MTKGSVRFLDTNILLRYLLRDDEEKARRALGLLNLVEQGREKVAISAMVIFEVIFTLQRRHQVPRQQIRDSVKDILSFRGLELPSKRLYERALDLYAARPNLSFPDAFHAVYMHAQGIEEIYSWDTDFDKLEGIRRVEPILTAEDLRDVAEQAIAEEAVERMGEESDRGEEYDQS